jgi:hypothetical protein
MEGTPGQTFVYRCTKSGRLPSTRLVRLTTVSWIDGGQSVGLNLENAGAFWSPKSVLELRGSGRPFVVKMPIKL